MDVNIDKIRAKYQNAAVTRCSEHGCGLSLAGLSQYVALKGEALVGYGKAVCDCVVFDARNELTASLIEIKSSSIKSNRIKRQFEGGGEKVIEMMRGMGLTEPPMIVILVAKNYSRWIQHRDLRRARVRIGQKKYPIILLSCNAKLADVIYVHNLHKFDGRITGRGGTAGRKSHRRKRTRFR